MYNNFFNLPTIKEQLSLFDFGGFKFCGINKTGIYVFLETTTEAGEPYRFFEAPSPGIQLRVNTDAEVHISLTSFDFIWNPSVEIIIGTRNNTLSTVIRNQDTQIAVAHSPNIIRTGQWTGLRVTWASHAIVVTREGQSFPFLVYNLECIFRIGFYGLRSP